MKIYMLRNIFSKSPYFPLYKRGLPAGQAGIKGNFNSIGSPRTSGFGMQNMMLFILLLPIIISSISKADSNNKGTTYVGTNFRIYPSDVTQTEVLAAVHPSDPNIIFASANTIKFNPFFISEGIYLSTDGGTTWTGNDTCTGAPIQFHGGDPGVAIDKNGTFILTRLGITPFVGLYSHFSTDNGMTWSDQKTIADHDLERATIGSDGSPTSSFYGRTYAAWVRFAPPYPVYLSYTDDGGVNWSTPDQINNPTKRNAGGDIDIGNDGKVHVCWAGVADQSPFTEILVGHASSTNGSSSWTIQESAFAMNGIQGILPQKQNIRVNGLPRIAIDKSGGVRNGWIYIVTTQKNLSPAGSDPDIILNRSSDGGATWSSGIRVNQDALNNGKIQYFPAIVVDNNGGVNIVYYDDRMTSSDSSGLFLSRSTDGGDTWADVEISDHHFKPAPIGGLGQGYQGDNIDVAVCNNTLWPMWMDNSSGIYQIWTAPIDLTSVGIEGISKQSVLNTFRLKQNYPNPFNPSTVIEYQLFETDFVTIKIFDIHGKEMATLINEKRPAGKHQVQFDASLLPSGIYYYKLATHGFSQTKAMVLIK